MKRFLDARLEALLDGMRADNDSWTDFPGLSRLPSHRHADCSHMSFCADLSEVYIELSNVSCMASEKGQL